MQRHTVAAALAVSLLWGCGPATSTSTPVASVPLRLTAEVTECPGWSRCVGYLSFVPGGGVATSELRLPDLGERQVARGLPALEPGSYLARFRLTSPSDLILNGVSSEDPVATCAAPFEMTGTAGVLITVTSRSFTCEVVVTEGAPSG
jgi:hypothetical protein